jgi:hypothetical protein
MGGQFPFRIVYHLESTIDSEHVILTVSSGMYYVHHHFVLSVSLLFQLNMS